LRGVYLLLAGDLWLDMVEHGGRYGIGEFNVAHFVWLDDWLPLPTASSYLALLIASGFIALSLALGPAPRWLRALLAATYTLAWTISLHDSYQHHYLLSWLLAWCAALPDLTPHEARAETPVRGWGLPMTAVTCAIVYSFTGVAKSELEWRSGEVLRAITKSRPPGASEPGKFDAARDLLVQLGVEEATVWQLFALSTIALQWTIAAGYLAAPRRDEDPARWRVWVVSLGLLAAFSFHAVAEFFQVFEIGLFSYYMMMVALVLLGPTTILTLGARGVSWVSDRIDSPHAQRASSAPGSKKTNQLQIVLTRLWSPLLSVGMLAGIGYVIPLPGARAASWSLAMLLVVRIAISLKNGAIERWEGDRLALNAAATTFLMWLALTQTAVPFDYYRRTAGELSRMGRLEEALSAYRLAERFAPEGQSRAATIREIQRELQGASQHRRTQ
jgi:Vitamin K-dependent gamma-carboxylase